MKKIYRLFLLCIVSLALFGCAGNTDDTQSKNDTLKGLLQTDSQLSLPYDMGYKIDEAIGKEISLYTFEPTENKKKYVCVYINREKYDSVDTKHALLKEYDEASQIEARINGATIIASYIAVDGKLGFDYINGKRVDIRARYFYDSELESICGLDFNKKYAVWAATEDRLENHATYQELGYVGIVRRMFEDYYQLYEIEDVDGVSYIKDYAKSVNEETGESQDLTYLYLGQYREKLIETLIPKENDYVDKGKIKDYYGLFQIDTIVDVIKNYKKEDYTYLDIAMISEKTLEMQINEAQNGLYDLYGFKVLSDDGYMVGYRMEEEGENDPTVKTLWLKYDSYEDVKTSNYGAKYVYKVFTAELTKRYRDGADVNIKVKYYYRYSNGLNDVTLKHTLDMNKEYLIFAGNAEKLEECKNTFGTAYPFIVSFEAYTIEKLYDTKEQDGNIYLKQIVGIRTENSDEYLDMSAEVFGKYLERLNNALLEEKEIVKFDQKEIYFAWIKLQEVLDIINNK